MLRSANWGVLYSHSHPLAYLIFVLVSLKDKDAQSVTFLQLEGWSLEPELGSRVTVATRQGRWYVSVLITPFSSFQLIPLVRLCYAVLYLRSYTGSL